MEVAIYRILAETLANVINHADASNAYVEIEVDEDTVSLDVIDDGTGLPAKPRPDGIGLTSMRERTQEIGGHRKDLHRLGELGGRLGRTY